MKTAEKRGPERPSTYGRGRHAPSLADRFWMKVEKSDGCWLWKGVFDGVGYGQLGFNYKHVEAHRLSWEIHHGQIPEGAWVLHKCDVRACVRPDHLFLGTHQDNVDDAVSKGRHLSGEQCHFSKATWALVEEARRLYAIDRTPVKRGRGKYRQIDIARILRLPHPCVKAIVMGRTWVRR